MNPQRYAAIGFMGLFILAVGVAAVGLNVVTLGAYPGTFQITVKNQATSQPVSGAAVSVYLYSGLLVGSGVTNSNGWVEVAGFYEQTLTVKVVASGYAEKTTTLTFFGGQTSATVFISPSSTPTPTYVRVGVYCVTEDHYRVKGVEVIGDGSTGITDGDGFAEVLVLRDGDIRFSGEGAQIQRTTLWEEISFSTFTRSVSVGGGETFTAYVQSGVIIEADPPSAETPSDDPVSYWWVWLENNTFWLISTALGLYLFSILFWGQGPELIKMGLRRK